MTGFESSQDIRPAALLVLYVLKVAVQETSLFMQVVLLMVFNRKSTSIRFTCPSPFAPKEI